MTRRWQAGDRLTLRLPMEARQVKGHHCVDAVPGAVAIERGPLVYAIEQVSVQGLQSLEPLHNVPMTTVPEAAAIMRVSEVVITRLISTGRLSGYHRRNQESMRMNLVIPTAQMEEFHRRYVSASEVWRSGIPLLHVTRILREHGCDLAFPGNSFGARSMTERRLKGSSVLHRPSGP